LKPFLDTDFLLDSTTAQWLYHDVAAHQPIIDYHCHLPPDRIANNHRFANLSEIWLHGDHYKWRAMRTCGVDERFCTGDAPDREKFEAWAAVVPKTLRNPLYHWTHLELRHPFGIENTLLGPDTAKAIWDTCNAKLATDAFTTQGLLKQFRVEVVCTTDDPVDSLSYHAQHRANAQSTTQLFPTWRPDRVLMLDDPPQWNAWIDSLSEMSATSIASLDDLRAALKKRHDFFHEQGCRLSDHGLETAHASAYTERELVATFAHARSGEVPSLEAIDKFRSAMLYEMALWDHARGWTQQFHFGAQRNNNSRAFTQIGRDTGYDSMGDLPIARPLQHFLDRLDGTDQLARTILYNLNPRDNQLLVTMMGNFQGRIPGKMQYGSGWWFLDQKHGMEQQLNDLSDLGILSLFVGMLTDSRSFLSYSRHEYFRRILCNILGDEVERGLLPNDRGLLSQLVEGVCYTNARDYFGFDRR
jgi:glucuronate isomerase